MASIMACVVIASPDSASTLAAASRALVFLGLGSFAAFLALVWAGAAAFGRHGFGRHFKRYACLGRRRFGERLLGLGRRRRLARRFTRPPRFRLDRRPGPCPGPGPRGPRGRPGLLFVSPP